MTRINNISAVLFDMDGTLVDSEIFTAKAIRTVCIELGISVKEVLAATDL